MHGETEVSFVDAHSERLCGTEQSQIPVQEFFLYINFILYIAMVQIDLLRVIWQGGAEFPF